MRYRAEALRTAIYQSNRYIPDRHLPDKAIDVIDEAGARVKLRRVRDTQNLRRLEQEIRQVVKEMKVAISDKDFERAVYLREREIELREDLERMSVATDETGVLEVTRHDIEEVISSWTGIPVAALQSEEAERLLKMEDILQPARGRPGPVDHRRSAGRSAARGWGSRTRSGRWARSSSSGPRGSARPRSPASSPSSSSAASGR